MQQDATGQAAGFLMASAGRGVVLERDLVLSDMTVELFAIILRESPLAALRWASGRHDGPPPFHPEALRYDWRAVDKLRGRLADGQSIDIASALPAGWRTAILEHLGLSGEPRSRPPYRESVEPAARGLRAYAKALRIQQWSKNLLVFVPVVMSHQFLDPQALANAVAAFLCFGLVASSIYVLNDVMDLRQDRGHPTKRRRPFASGAVPLRHGLLLPPILLGCAGMLALLLPPMFWLAMAAYLALNVAYTFCLKRKLLVDVVALSGAYTLRILAGNAAGPIELSNWLLAFSMFVFLSLALVKRYVELDTVATSEADEKRVMGRGYRKGDLDMIAQLGVSCGVAAVIVLALFVDGAGKSGLYTHREVIWLICPIVLYVVGRVWILAKRRELPDDPVAFMLTDWRTYVLGVIIAILFYFAV